MLVVVRLQEASQRMVIRPKRIYNFCLFHAYMGDIAMCLLHFYAFFNTFGLTY